MGFKPLADDTELDVEARQVAAWRSMSAAQKAALVVSASRAADAMALAGIRARFPESAVTAKRIDVTLDLERAIAESAD